MLLTDVDVLLDAPLVKFLFPVIVIIFCLFLLTISGFSISLISTSPLISISKNNLFDSLPLSLHLTL